MNSFKSSMIKVTGETLSFFLKKKWPSHSLICFTIWTQSSSHHKPTQNVSTLDSYHWFRLQFIEEIGHKIILSRTQVIPSNSSKPINRSSTKLKYTNCHLWTRSRARSKLYKVWDSNLSRNRFLKIKDLKLKRSTYESVYILRLSVYFIDVVFFWLFWSSIGGRNFEEVWPSHDILYQITIMIPDSIMGSQRSRGEDQNSTSHRYNSYLYPINSQLVRTTWRGNRILRTIKSVSFHISDFI